MRSISNLDEFRKRTERSRQIYNEAKEYIPYGVNSNYRYIDPYPVYFKSGKGSKLYDVDGNEYLDFNMAFGALTIGHSHPKLINGIKERIESGTIIGFEYEGSLELAKLITKIYNLDMVRFSSTGGEATQAAVRIARSYTSKKKILKFEGCYHGSHDSLLVSVKPPAGKGGYFKYPLPVLSGPGVVQSAADDIIVAPFNDIEAVSKIVEKNYNDIAAIILEPVAMNMGLVIPKEGFLETLRKLSDEYNIVLIFDEIKTGSKHYGGASSYFNVKPDLMTLGKAIAGGFPLSVVGGKKEIMSVLGPGKTPHAGTFNSNPLSIDASLITLKDIFLERDIRKAEEISKEMAKGYKDIIEDYKIPMNVNQWSLSGSLYFGIDSVENWRDFLKTNVSLWYEYLYGMMNKGIIPAAPGPDEQWTVSIVHTLEEANKNMEAFKEISESLKNVKSEEAIVESI
ncbi:MAG: aspartate aminotransferase family protein [Thermoplasmatales archaeon]